MTELKWKYDKWHKFCTDIILSRDSIHSGKSGCVVIAKIVTMSSYVKQLAAQPTNISIYSFLGKQHFFL